MLVLGRCLLGAYRWVLVVLEHDLETGHLGQLACGPALFAPSGSAAPSVPLSVSFAGRREVVEVVFLAFFTLRIITY